VSERKKGKRKARPKSRDTYGSRAAQSGGPFLSFFLSRRAPPTTAATTAPHHTGVPEHARTARNGARQQAAAARGVSSS